MEEIRITLPELIPTDKGFYVGDGNHRISALILQYQSEVSKAANLQELEMLKQKYTVPIPVWRE